MIRVNDLQQFQRLSAEHIATFAYPNPRTVRLRINAPQRTPIYYLPATPAEEGHDYGEPIFLALCEGLEEVEFYTEGPYALSVEADIWLFTLDGSVIHAETPDEETYTRIMERRPRDPNVERMEAALLQSNAIRMAAVINDLRRETQTAINAALAERASPASGDSSSPEPDAGSGDATRSAAATAVGTEGSNSDAKPS